MEKKSKQKTINAKKPGYYMLPDNSIDIGKIEVELRTELKARRYQHVQGVMQVARAMAANYNETVARAELAGLLHDCARGMSLEQMQTTAREAKLDIDEIELGSKALLHAVVGAYLARARFGVTDEGVLNAIRYHTTGRPDMSRLEAIIYLADMIEPSREPYPALNELRALSSRDLYIALEIGLQSSIVYVGKQGQPMHARSMEALRWARELNAQRRAQSNAKL